MVALFVFVVNGNGFYRDFSKIGESWQAEILTDQRLQPFSEVQKLATYTVAGQKSAQKSEKSQHSNQNKQKTHKNQNKERKWRNVRNNY